MSWFSADLHVHSCLSPCGSLEASPRAIAVAARAAGMDLVALCDHNSAKNAPAFAFHCAREGLVPLFGLECTSAEEVHCLAIFSEVQEALDFGDFIYSHLLPIPNDPLKWGDQVWVNEDDEIEGEVEYLLISATGFSVDELLIQTHAAGGLFIPAHVDRAMFSMCSQLGFVPEGDYDAIEVTKPGSTYESLGLAESRHSFVCDSDAHEPEAVGSRYFEFESDSDRPSFASLRDALKSGRIRRHFSPAPSSRAR